MVDSFQELNFLLRSNNRIAILETLAEGSFSEAELIEETGTSKITVRRILDAFTERGWVRHTEEVYTTSPIGDFLVRNYRRLSEATDIVCRLGPVSEDLPLDQMTFDFEHLRNARIPDPETFDAMRELDRVFDHFRRADRIVGLANFPAETLVQTILEEVTHGTHYEAVWGPKLIDILHESTSFRESAFELAETDAEVSLSTDASIPTGVAVYDEELAGIGGFNDVGSLRTVIETRANPVIEWVHSTYEQFQATATPLTVEAIEEMG